MRPGIQGIFSITLVCFERVSLQQLKSGCEEAQRYFQLVVSSMSTHRSSDPLFKIGGSALHAVTITMLGHTFGPGNDISTARLLAIVLRYSDPLLDGRGPVSYNGAIRT